ncbi:MAG: protein kinase [Acidobacteriota bacterium]
MTSRTDLPQPDETLVQTDEQQAASQMLSTGWTVARHGAPGYTLQRHLGRGAFGEVWLARDDNTGRQVAVKFFSRAGLDWELLQREVAKLLKVVAERRIVQLLKVGWDAETPYYVMEYLEGGSLQDRIAERTLTVAEATDFFRQLTEALVYLHGKAILHCDLKPANVLLDDHDQVRLADFGQARLSDEEGPTAGTLFYMAPEVARRDGKPDVRSDLYSLGALFYAMLTGAPPYATDEVSRELASTGSVNERVERYRGIIENAPELADHRDLEGMDSDLVEILDKCLARDPAQRFDNAQEVLEALDDRDRRLAQRPLLAFGLAAPLVLMLVIMATGAYVFSRTEARTRDALVEQGLEANLAVARVVAAAVDRNLEAVKRRVGREANRSALANALEGSMARPSSSEQRRWDDLQRAVDALHDAYDDRGFFSWVLADRRALARARAPYDPRVVGSSYGYREWFSGRVERRGGDLPELAEPRRDVGLTLAFRSTAEGQPVLMSVAAPVRGAGDVGTSEAAAEPLGVLAATLHLDTLNEWLSAAESRPADGGCPERLVVLLHRGQLVRHPCPAEGMNEPPLPPADYFDRRGMLELLDHGSRTHASYQDPLRPGQVFLAAASPFGTGDDWIALVLQDRHRALEPLDALVANLERLALLAAVVAILVVLALWSMLLKVTGRSLWPARAGAKP